MTRPTPGLGGTPDDDPDGPEYPRPESGLAPNVLGMKALVYGGCALIVLGALGLVIWALWP